MPPAPRRILRLLVAPVTDTFYGLERCLEKGVPALGLVALGLVVGWWIYVPIHELLHAVACLATGGSVTRLDIDPLYGGALLAGWISWVESGGEYAGQLSGFDTGGSDLIYLATVFGPYLLTLWPGVWLLRYAAQRRGPFLFGFSLPVALAPFISLPGDSYEIGAILTTWIPPWSRDFAHELLRGDDIVKVASGLSEAAATLPLWVGFALALLGGLFWALATYTAGAAVAQALGRGAVTPDPRPIKT